MVQEQSFATGGWGPNETFVKPGSSALAESLAKTHASFETPCGAYGHFKITRYLLLETADSRYGDSMERVLYNTILGAKPLQPDGTSFYYSDYNDHAQKGYFEKRQENWNGGQDHCGHAGGDALLGPEQQSVIEDEDQQSEYEG